ncbi:MAG: MoaD/ThiS family protein [Pseudomonadota bacterium]
MQKILYFGRLSDVTGCQEERLEIPADIETAGALRNWLDKRYGAGGVLLDPTVRIALDNEIIFDGAPLHAASEIAFMPPVGGG